jgi:hypothetical protein
MYEYGQYCPVARATEILADRWTPLIIRELLAGIRHFNDLDRGLPGISRALLVDRLRRLERTKLVERRRAPTAGRRNITSRPRGASFSASSTCSAAGARAGPSAIRAQPSSIPSCCCGG